MLLNEKNQDGGTVLGSGGFGCVISPPLKCKNHFNKIPYSIDKKYISKIVEYIKDDDEMMNEIKIGSKLAKLDPHQKYFSPIINGCHFYKQSSNDISYQSYKPFDYNNNNSNNSNDNNNDSKIEKCNIYDNEEYLNLISKNAGINIKEALNSKKPEIISFFKKNYVIIFKHICYSLYLLHKNNILHRDIKSLNMMINYNNDRNKANITIIDFGLSEELKKSYSLRDLYYLTYAGTENYKPIEIIITNYILSVLKKNKFNETKNFKKIVINKVVEDYKEISEEYVEKYFFTESGFNYNNNKLNKNIINEKLSKYGNKEVIFNIFSHLYKDLNENKLSKNLIENDKNILKWDIFSLGLLFAEIIIKANINDDKAFAFVNKMITPYYWDRYDIKQCLKDPLFKNDITTKKHKSITKKHKSITKKHKSITKKHKI
jgi:serine/threonine protein kinase